MTIETLSTHRVHGGTLRYCKHASTSTGTPMKFTVWTPDGEGPFPYLVWLSGLTCTEDNFTVKSGVYAHAAQHGIAIVAPDTSPRGEGVADDPAYDLGQGAGFYVDATQAPWAPHFMMHSYVTGDLLAAVEGAFPLDSARKGIFGHSMGGRVLADRLAAELPVGRQGADGLPGPRPRRLAALRRLRPDRGRQGRKLRRHPDRPGLGRQLPGKPAEAAADPSRRRQGGPQGHGPAPGGLRPQLLLHLDLHRRSRGVPRGPVVTFS